MVEKLKFKPVITRIKLNPEQAVLACQCYTRGYLSGAAASTRRASTCTAAKGLVNRIYGPSGIRS